MANTHHTGIPKLQWSFNYPPCTPSVTIVADKNPFCLGDSVTFTPTFACVDDVTITAYGWVVNGSIQSTSAEPFVTNTLTNGNSVYMFFITSTGQTYFSNVITMQEKTEGCPTLIKYGLLYNWYAATDARNICAEGWHIPSKLDQETLANYVGEQISTYSWSGGDTLKETGSVYWAIGNTGTNINLFNGRGSGFRNAADNIFSNLQFQLFVLSSDSASSLHGWRFSLGLTSSSILFGSFLKTNGLSIRPIKDSTTLMHGQTGIYFGNDGKVYRTICIGTQEWLADNLAETKFRNDDWIPGYDGGSYQAISNAAWANLTDSALCAYNDDLNNV